MNLTKKSTRTILYMILILSFVVNILTFKNGHDWGGDFSGYIYQAKSLVEGTTAELVVADRYLIENSTTRVGGLLSPWGFPIALSPVYYFFGLNIYAMKVLISLFFGLSLLAVFLFFRDRLSNLQNLILVSILAFNPWFFEFKDNLLSDIPFLFFSLISLLLIKEFVISKKVWVNRPVSYLAIGAVIFASYSIRSVGLVLLPVLLTVQYIQSRSSLSKRGSLLKEWFNYLPYIIFIILTISTAMVFPENSIGLYLDNLSGTDFSRIFPDIIYLSLLPSRFFSFLHLNMNAYGLSFNKFSLVAYNLIVFVTVFGMIRNRKKDYLLILYILFTIPVLLLFSNRQGLRLLIPLLPFFIYFLIAGLSQLSLSLNFSDKYAPLTMKMDILAGSALVLISIFYISFGSYQNIVFNRSEVIEGPYMPDSIGLFDYIRTRTDKDDAIIFFKPMVLTLYTGRKSALIRDIEDISRSSARYAAYRKRDLRHGGQTVQGLRDDFGCVFENETFILCASKKKPGR